MSIDSILLIGAVLALAGYLLAALVRPEWFS